MWNCEEIIPIDSKFTMFDGESLKNVESASLFEALPSNLGYVQALFLSDMDDNEIEFLSKGNISFRYIKGEAGFVLALIHFEGTDLFIEVDFDPTTYKDDRAMQLIQSNNSICFVGIESTNLQVKVSRKIVIPLKLANIWSSTWAAALNINDFSSKYKNWIESLRNNYDSHELWSIAKPVGIIKN
ncbi:hypothetical protein [Bacillus thuringiensis]|uniref:hypothetical protein n=1 Tax=Bacillus thuringiensis TaxID=1428 RepID=UPI0021D661EF|nr:hypothetical protein [Bacillus thuringiensis]MCU7667219.1 hypothetical protein [Bacillus thuringiensis]